MRPVERASKPIEMKGQNKNHQIFPVEISHTRWKSGPDYFNTIIIRDMTERKEYEQKLIQAMKEAKAANKAKSEFLTTISHELRTPLNAIIGFDQCLILGMDGEINEQQMISLKKIEKSSFHLLNLINNILDLAKIEAHKMELEIDSYNIIDIIRSSLEEISPLAERKKISIKFFNHLSQMNIQGDKLRLRQVFLNLLGNAVKFTHKGSIRVYLINHADKIEVQISDTGIGLTQEEINKLFKPFSQADSSITRKYGGTGLGLAISKKIIDMHCGEIQVKSEKNKGSTFSIFLPKIHDLKEYSK
jgi:signal transduction histidine kinase